MTYAEAVPFEDRDAYNRMAQQDDALGPVPCRVCGNDPCTCGHHEEPYACNGICITSDEIGVPGYGVAYPHPDCDLHGDPDGRLQRLAVEQTAVGLYLQRGGDRIAACDWCGQHTCDQRDDHQRLMAQREQTWRER